MAKSSYEISREVTINNELGLHARAAAKIAALAQKAESKIWLLKNEEKADASRILDMLTLACPKGTKIMVSADGYSDIKILDSIVELVQRGFEE
jgi:phosphotransferase system HPr (HPr) family protein